MWIRRLLSLSLSRSLVDFLASLKLFEDDPWMAAHQFLERNDLSQMFLDQVVDFIQKNTKGVTIGQQAETRGDPFTGEKMATQ